MQLVVPIYLTVDVVRHEFLNLVEGYFNDEIFVVEVIIQYFGEKWGHCEEDMVQAVF